HARPEPRTLRTSRALARRVPVLLAVAAALGVGALRFAPAARAEPIATGVGLDCKLVAGGFTNLYPPGTRITVQYADGEKETYTCVNGEWVKELSVLSASTLSAGTFYAATSTFVPTRSVPVVGTTSATVAR